MNLSLAIESYLANRRSTGLVFNEVARILSAFSKSVGDIPLTQLRTEQVREFLDSGHANATTWRIKHNKLRTFFEYWRWRNEMPFLIMPPQKARIPRTFIPYIYTRTELRNLLSATRASQKSTFCKADPATLKMLIVMLYATGARVSEIINIRRRDVDLKRSRLTLIGLGKKPPRCIPIGRDLKQRLETYFKRKGHGSRYEGAIFKNKFGEQLTEPILYMSFARMRKIAGIVREESPCYGPRLLDLRFTFAVHRITDWLRGGADLNRLLPALSTYMGNLCLETADQYLAITPERFRKELKMLSPKRGRRRWRDDPALMKFLRSL